MQASLHDALAVMNSSVQFSAQAVSHRFSQMNAVLASAAECTAPISPDEDRKVPRCLAQNCGSGE